LNKTALNRTANLLSSANPSASTYAFVVDAGLLLASATSSSTPPASNSASPTPEPDPKGMSGGTIGGIVVGVIGGLALLGTAVFYTLRKRKAKQHEKLPQDESAFELHSDVKEQYHMRDGGDVLELSRNERPAELEQPHVHIPPVELPAENIRRQHVDG